MSNEQRNAPRFEVELPGLVGTNNDPEYVDMVLQNLSLGGCFIATDCPEAPGAVLDLRFRLPGVHDLSVTARGRVCWIKNDPKGGPVGMGVQFVSLAASQMDKLKRYLTGFLDTDSA